MMIQTTAATTRQAIEAQAKGETNEAILRSLRDAWKEAPVGACNLEGHEDRPAIEAVKIIGGYVHNCAECAPRYAAMIQRIAREGRRRSAEAGMRGARAQTFHRQ